VRAICERGINDPLFRALMKEYPNLAYGCENYSYNFYENIEAKIVNLYDFDDLTADEKATHCNFTFRIITDRGVTHELVRHRPASFAQESTRYVNYKNGLSIALPSGFYDKPEWVQNVYQKAFESANMFYHDLIEYCNQTPQQARAVLPMATKTEIVVTTNFEEWMHIINLRYFGTTGQPHPDIKFVIEKVFKILKEDKLVGELLNGKM
jgi:thymidylate synthase ThyX